MILANTCVETVTTNQRFFNYLACVGLIVHQNKIFVTQRKACQPMPFYWEFPGGKLETAESAQVALTRELLEETGIQVNDARQIMSLKLPDAEKWLAIWEITHYLHEPYGKEDQTAQWVDLEQLRSLKILPANDIIISYITQTKLLT